MTQFNNLADAFAKFFEIIPVSNDSDLIDEVYKIRYQVYCEELQYEDKTQFPDKKEFDQFDKHSQHLLLRHITSNKYAGTVRVVRNYNEIDDKQLPIEHCCKHSIDPIIFNTARADRTKFAEISRLAVISAFRKRTGEKNTQHSVKEQEEVLSSDDRRMFPHIALGLYLAAGAVLVEEKLDHALVMMQRRLVRHMRMFDINFMCAGHSMELNGPRCPYIIDVKKNLQKINPEIDNLLAHISTQIKNNK